MNYNTIQIVCRVKEILKSCEWVNLEFRQLQGNRFRLVWLLLKGKSKSRIEAEKPIGKVHNDHCVQVIGLHVK